ncbi:MAG: UDP-glucose/GDP-mannose dehydrogenase family protein [Planctomycetes bacterium]|nr:UDP-glucose/GDP-mannose dehydrogenase family protein [Planctomycetota bacterium]
MRLSVVGVGYVGLVAAGCLADVGNEVICIDKDKKKIADLKKGIIPIYEPGLTEIIKRNEAAGRLSFTTNLKEGIANSTIIFLAVGTPSSADGSADISAVLAVCKEIADLMDSYKIIVTKSTVPVGTHKKVHEIISSNTTESFGYVSNPEFLKEGSAVEDFMKPDRIIIGTDNAEAREQMNFLYSPFMRKKSKVIFMDAASAELTKYAANCMLATRISFMNELSGLCEQVGADIESVRTGIGSDSRIGNAFLFPGVGFGGSCFPKDVRALIHTGNENDSPMTIVDSVQKANIRQQERFAQKVIDYYSTSGEKITLAVWGLSFKARTDDVRESPAIYCIEKFIEAGIAVKAYDPEAMGSARALLADQIEYSKDSYKALENCDGLVILTDWQEFRNPDFEAISTNLKNAIIFDGRNLYDPAYIKKQGIEYHSIGR